MYAFRIVNVFAENASLTGNPLAVFEDAQGLGSAHVARKVLALGDDLLLEMQAGIIPVRAAGDDWALTANAPHWRAPHSARPELAAMLGLTEADLAADSVPLWIDTGSEQLVIPLASAEAVRRTQPDAQAMRVHADNGQRTLAYVFAREGRRVLARFFFLKHGAVTEDPGTGSACANLGGWLVATGAPLPQSLAIEQGEAVGRRCRLGLEVGRDTSIRVSGRVVEIARGTVTL